MPHLRKLAQNAAYAWQWVIWIPLRMLGVFLVEVWYGAWNGLDMVELKGQRAYFDLALKLRQNAGKDLHDA